MRPLQRISALILLSSVLAVSALHAVPEIFPLSEIKPGMKGTVYTVMRGSEVVPIETEILGVLEGGIAPGRHMIIGKLVDEKTELTGAVHGMSGSPLMIDGKLVGALSRRLMLFEKDGHCGFTPAEDMVDVSRRGHDDASGIRLPENSRFSMPLAVSGGANNWGVLEEKIKEWFPGAVPVAGGQAGKQSKELPPLEAGSPLAVVLMDGDITMAGTGTVTWVEGNQVVGFGHPMFGLGQIEFPIAPAEIITVLPSYMMPHKISNAGMINGTLDQDRLSAVSGRIGPIPDMATYRIRRRHNNESRPIWQGRMVKHHLIAPQLISVLASNAMMDEQDFSGEFTMRSKTTVKFAGYDDYVMEGVYSGSQMDRLLAIFDQLLPLMRIMGQFEQQLELESVFFDVETIESHNNWVITSLDTESDEVKVGEKLNLIVELRNDKGEAKQIRSFWNPPEELRGQRLTLECISGLNLNAMHQNSSAVLAGDDPAAALLQLKSRYLHDTIYIRGSMRSTALLKSGQLQSGLPHTVYSVARENPWPDTAQIAQRIVYAEERIELDGMVSGVKSKTVMVK
ncbi:MAG: SpoIVB peptidase S55 domain-containing protein [Verrucomicrobiota bacterium]